MAKFKPEVILPDSRNKPANGSEHGGEMISLLQPSPYTQNNSSISAINKQFMPPPYIATNSHNGAMIDEQTGYSNSPKFSIYRLNNQSHMKGNESVFED